MIHRGQCQCGATRFTVSGPIEAAWICHCSQCRRANGSAFNIAVPVDGDRIDWIARDHVTEYESSPGKYRGFCGRCGSPLWSRRDVRPDHYRLKGGLFDALTPERTEHIFWADRLPWVEAMNDLSKHDAFPPDWRG